MQKSRPVNLNLFTIRFPVTAIISILHRLSGVIMFLFIGLLLYALNQSLKSPDSFGQLQVLLTYPLSRFIIWVFLSSLLLHIFAGLRHIVMDFGFAEEKTNARISAYSVIILSILFILALGVRLW
jgi:succinate dehydrogenase / fumarate reductase cytochrome b subunit